LIAHLDAPIINNPLATATRPRKAAAMDITDIDTKLVTTERSSLAKDRNLQAHGTLRAQIFRVLLSNVGKAGGRLVDLGAGPCLFAKFARDHGYDVTAVDARIDRKPPDDQLGSIRFIQADVREFDLSGFDIIVCLGLFYHFDVDDQLALLRKCAQTRMPVIFETQVHIEGLVPDDLTADWARNVVRRGNYEGIVFPEGTNAMASVVNTESFWPTEASLLEMFQDSGFRDVAKVDPVFSSKYGGRRFYLLNSALQQLVLPEKPTPVSVAEPTLSSERLRIAILVSRKQFDQARELLDRLPEGPIGASDWPFVLAVARLQIHSGECEKGIATVIRARDRALNFGPQASPVLLQCARILDAAGDSREAEAARTAAVGLVSSNKLVRSLVERAIASGDRDEARAILKIIERRFAEDSEMLEFAAVTYNAIEDFTSAERVSTAALKIEPLNPNLLSRLGFILARLDKVEKAAAVLQLALALDPQNQRILHRLTSLFIKLKRLDDAERSGRRLVDTAPGNADGHMLLASVMKQTQRREEALHHARRAAEINPANESYARYAADLEKPLPAKQGQAKQADGLDVKTDSTG